MKIADYIALAGDFTKRKEERKIIECSILLGFQPLYKALAAVKLAAY